MENREIICTIAPFLRLNYADKNVPAVVEFSEKCSCKDVAVFEPKGADQKELIALLKSFVGGLKQVPESVSVKDIGCFAISRQTVKPGRASGKVAIVTGAAQGFGLEIAMDLADQGGKVVLADMNFELAEKAAAGINQKQGEGTALAVKVNVTDGNSVADAVLTTVKRFGGFDLFLANAGVLKAESVKSQSEKDFDFVGAVNYKGYFLCAQKASLVLAAQHAAKPGRLSDIIQINSKSGLVGSNRNGAYAGSKFGGIGLTQSFAMELIEDGIKVNSICPGNFFDGPLWSDPANGLFAQYLRTGKVPGAKTVEDVKKFYEAKVPMGRGCRTADVMKAIYYIMEQEYETGQAIPVTGGQVMLK